MLMDVILRGCDIRLFLFVQGSRSDHNTHKDAGLKTIAVPVWTTITAEENLAAVVEIRNVVSSLLRRGVECIDTSPVTEIHYVFAYIQVHVTYRGFETRASRFSWWVELAFLRALSSVSAESWIPFERSMSFSRILCLSS